MKHLKRALVTCALVTSMVGPARASLALTFGGAPAVVVGVAAMGLAAGGAYGGYRLIKTGRPVLGGLAILGSAALGVFGFALLDGGQEAQFTELTPEGAEQLGISEAERAVYNEEVEQVNAIAREIGSELLRMKSNDPELARDMWMELGTELSPETMKTVIAIAQQG